VAVDRGGTWVRVLAASRAGEERAARRPASRVPDLERPLARLLRRWRIAPDEIGALVVASRGVWTAAERRAAEHGLRGLARRIRAISDVEAAYRGALGEGAGFVGFDHLVGDPDLRSLHGDARWRALVRRLGGTMSVSSELNHGSTFTITLPIRWATTNRNRDS